VEPGGSSPLCPLTPGDLTFLLVVSISVLNSAGFLLLLKAITQLSDKGHPVAFDLSLCSCYGC